MFNFIKKILKKDDNIGEDIEKIFSSLEEETKKTMEVAKEISDYLSYKNDDTDNKMKMVCNLLSCQVVIVDSYNKIHFVNEYTKNKFNLNLQECNDDFFNIFNFENIKEISDLYEKIKKQSSSQYYSIIVKNQKIESLVRISIINDLRKPIYAVVLIDVSERINYEKELIKTKNIFKMFSDISNDIILQTDYNGNIIQYNKKFTRITNITDGNINIFIKNLPADETYNKFETVFESDGRYIPIIINKRKLKIEGEDFYFYVIRDITTFKTAKEIVENKAERFYELLQYSYVSLVCFDENFKIKYFNDTFINDFNVDLTNKHTILDFLSTEDVGPFIRDITKLNEEIPVSRSLHLYNNEYKDWIVFRKIKNGTIEYQCSIRDVTSYFKINNTSS